MQIKIREKLLNMVSKALCESMNVKIMVTLVREFFPDYNLQNRMGYPENIPVANRDAARQILTDIRDHEFFPAFISLLIKTHYEGLMGKTYNIPYLKNIIKEIYEAGLIYDHENKMFIENSDLQKTRNWGVIRSGDEYLFTFLKIDIVGNTKLVRNNDEKKIQRAYKDLRNIVQTITEKRNGRIWNWEGDGGLSAFLFGEKHQSAARSGIEILHRLFIYNHFESKLESDINIRIAVHSGLSKYSHNMEEVNSCETIKKTTEIEAKHTISNSLTLSELVHSNLDYRISELFELIKPTNRKRFYNYSLNLEK